MCEDRCPFCGADASDYWKDHWTCGTGKLRSSKCYEAQLAALSEEIEKLNEVKSRHILLSELEQGWENE